MLDAFKFEEATETSITVRPLQLDPYEQSLVFVQHSTVTDADEGEFHISRLFPKFELIALLILGLFAKCDIEAGVVVSFYHGVHLSHDAVNGRSWDLNQNTITLDDDIVIDVWLHHCSRLRFLMKTTWSTRSLLLQIPRYENDIRNYASSLGHKANHSFDAPNAKVWQLSCLHYISS